jgi:hypothetical protein
MQDTGYPGLFVASNEASRDVQKAYLRVLAVRCRRHKKSMAGEAVGSLKYGLMSATLDDSSGKKVTAIASS